MRIESGTKRICIIGAGTMGSGIAAHLANLGFEVSLLDVSQSTAAEGLDRAKSAKPPHFYTHENFQQIQLGNIAEHLHWIAEADWVCEAIVERGDAKRSLYAKIEPHLRQDAWISTNTSGLQISLLADGRSDSFRRRFVGTHFFNPPRYLKLLELIPTPQSDPTTVAEMSRFFEDEVARRVVQAKDTPGFIANRYGMWCMFHAIHIAERLHLSIEEVDAITGAFLGRPKSASFRLNDIVGLDVMRDIATNLMERCPSDPNIGVLQLPNSMLHLVARGWIGEKFGHGYYRRDGKDLLVLDLQTFTYRQKRDVQLPTIDRLGSLPFGERLRAALELKDEVGEYLRHYLVPALRYANQLKEQISHSVLDFDRVMEWGFGWQHGPFATIDQIGAENIGLKESKFYEGNQMRSFSGSPASIVREPEYAALVDFPVVSQGSNFIVRDLGDGATAICSTTKLGMITPEYVDELTKFLQEKPIDRFVLSSEAKSFSVGFDLKYFQNEVTNQGWGNIEIALIRLHKLGELLEKRRCVASIFGYCLGAGLELALSCPQIVALAETQIGLPETKVGLIPGGRGVTLARTLNQSSAKRLADLALTLTRGDIATTADQARLFGLLRLTDMTVYHPDRLIFESKKAVLADKEFIPMTWKPHSGPLVGMIDRALDQATAKGELTEYDSLIGHKIKQIMARATSYDDSLYRERSEFVDLCNRAFTHARIRHMLETGKPLRN